MNITIVHNSIIPVSKYGGIERVIWYLAMELAKMGHKITFVVKQGSNCPFADVIPFEKEEEIEKLIPENTDFVHFHFQPKEEIKKSFLVTIHGNLPDNHRFFCNTNFVSLNHAKRFGADAFVYNGLSWDDYGKPELNKHHNYVHFLGKAAWRIKNVRGAIQLAHNNKTEIKILGGTRLNIKMGPRFTTSSYARFYGMVGGNQKKQLLKFSKGLIFPVLWHEPFGLAITESLYFGCPVMGTKYGSLPELVIPEVGILSNSFKILEEKFGDFELFNRNVCHEYALENFDSKRMAENYLSLYEKILNGEPINNKTPHFVESENILTPFIK